MFEGIKNTYANDEMTGASYHDGEVIGSVCFSSDKDRVGVISSIGTDDAVRECRFSHRVALRGRYRAAVSDVVEIYA